jgi:hypothetical protein
MKNLIIAIIAVGLIAASVGCTDTQVASFEALGKPGHIKCYSANTVIYEGDSTGRIQTVDSSDGWEFREAGDNAFIRVSGACVIKN